MALGEDSSNKTYLSVMFGKVVQKVSKDTEGAIPRENKKGDTVYEKRYKTVSGHITGISTRTHEEFGTDVLIQMVDGDEAYQIQIPSASGYGRAFLRRMMNIDYNEPVTLSPYGWTNDDGKEKWSMGIFQNDEKVEDFFWDSEKKKVINGLPELKEVKVNKNKSVWDDSDMMDFLFVDEETGEIVGDDEGSLPF
jgi:hypothetical protein